MTDMSLKLKHAFSGWTYEKTADGHVLVTNPANGTSGLFRADGRWISGAITSADIHMIGYVGGPHAKKLADRPDPGTRLARSPKATPDPEST